MAPPADLEENTSHHISVPSKKRADKLLTRCNNGNMALHAPRSADLSRCVLTSLYLRSKTPPYPPPLRPPRTDLVSLGKTKHSSAEVLISVTLRGWGRYRGTPNFRSTKHVRFAPASFSLDKVSHSSVRRAFGITHVMVSAFRSFQTTHQKVRLAQIRMAPIARNARKTCPFCTNQNGPNSSKRTEIVFAPQK